MGCLIEEDLVLFYSKLLGYFFFNVEDYLNW